MPRIARAVAVGCPHHVTQRGNGRRNVFFSEFDRAVYLDTFFEYAARFSLRVWGYCLMDNHVHFVAVPESERSLARVFGRTHADYARYAHVAHGGCGHLWQARFYSCALDDGHAWAALAYVERNPVRARMVAAAEEYRWSSAAAHCGSESRHSRLDLTEWAQRYNGPHWREALGTSLAEAGMAERIREATRRGSPLGDERFVTRLGQELGRDLRVKPPGRPAKVREFGVAAGA